jgi:hypothetical protein
MRQLFFDGRDKVQGTNANFTIQLPETLVVDGDTPHRFRIDNLRIPHVFTTISSSNNTLQVTLAATPYTVTLPIANYTGTTFQSMLQAQLQAAAPGTWTVVYDLNNISMSISCTNNFTISATVGFGIQLLSRPYTQTANSYACSYVSMAGADVIYLTSSLFNRMETIGPNGAHDTLMAVNVVEPYASVIIRDMPYDVWLPMPAMQTGTIDFALRDRSYNVLTATPNFSLSMTID